MHELSLCSAIADTVGERSAGRRVRAVKVRIGHYRQVVPDTLAYCWELVVADTPLAGAALEVEEVPAVVSCRACGEHTTLDMPILLCGSCDGADVVMVSGDELLLESIDLEPATEAQDVS